MQIVIIGLGAFINKSFYFVPVLSSFDIHDKRSKLIEVKLVHVVDLFEG